MTARFYTVISVVAMLLLLVGCGVSGCSQDSTKNQTIAEPTKYRVQFGWAFDAHHVGFLLAKERGFYKSSGLEVSLLPGGFDSSPVRTLMSGGAEIAQVSGAEQYLAARAEGLPIVPVAAFHRQSPHALISLQDRPIRTAKDLVGKRVAVAYGDTAEFLLRDYMARHSVDVDKVKFVPFRFNLSVLLDGEVDAITGFATDQPHTLSSRGHAPVVLRYSEEQPVGYGYMFVQNSGVQTTEQTKKFLEASRRGWSAAFNDPDSTLDLLLKSVDGLNREVEAKKLKAVRQIMVANDSSLAPWCIVPSAINSVGRRMLHFKQLEKMPEVKSSDFPDVCK